jgi:hypothetical protein
MGIFRETLDDDVYITEVYPHMQYGYDTVPFDHDINKATQ